MRNEKEEYLVEAQVVLDGVRRVEDGPTGCEDHDETVERLRAEPGRETVSKRVHSRKWKTLC